MAAFLDSTARAITFWLLSINTNNVIVVTNAADRAIGGRRCYQQDGVSNGHQCGSGGFPFSLAPAVDTVFHWPAYP